MAEHLILRTCGRTGCRWPASSSLSFRYASRQVWLFDLSSEPDPNLYDLCPHHADALTVPMGWEQVDERTHPDAVQEPAGRDLLRDREPVAVGAGNRYEELTRALPELARQVAVAPSAKQAGGAAHGFRDAGQRGHRDPAGEMPGGDLAPTVYLGAPGSSATSPGGAAAARPGWPDSPAGQKAGATEQDAPGEGATGAQSAAREGGTEEGTSDEGTSEEGVDAADDGSEGYEGQLAMEVDEDGERDAGDAVVVSIEAAGSRRRGDQQSSRVE